jgi:G3E family GTPase
MLDALPPALVRAKGILHLADEPSHQMILQVVGKRWELERGAPWGDDAPQSRLVLIAVGDAIDWASLERALAAC